MIGYFTAITPSSMLYWDWLLYCDYPLLYALLRLVTLLRLPSPLCFTMIGYLTVIIALLHNWSLSTNQLDYKMMTFNLIY